MDTLYFFGGVVVGSVISYYWFMIGRNTGYQDKGAFPPPAPLADQPKKDKPKPRYGMVDELHDPSIGDLRPEEQ